MVAGAGERFPVYYVTWFDACDENHLSVIGAEKLTSLLDSIIHTVVQ